MKRWSPRKHRTRPRVDDYAFLTLLGSVGGAAGDCHPVPKRDSTVVPLGRARLERLRESPVKTWLRGMRVGQTRPSCVITSLPIARRRPRGFLPDLSDGDPASLSSFEASLTPATLTAALTSLGYELQVNLLLPRFSFSTRLELTPLLGSMGAPDLFNPSTANLYGGDGPRAPNRRHRPSLPVSDPRHQEWQHPFHGSRRGSATRIVTPSRARSPSLCEIRGRSLFALLRELLRGERGLERAHPLFLGDAELRANLLGP